MPAPEKKERLLSVLGYDISLVSRMASEDVSSLRAVGVAWLVSCLVLGVGAAHAAWLILSEFWFAGAVGLAIVLLCVNLLRVLHAGGGVGLGQSPSHSARRCARYRPSLAPALVFGFLAAVLSQPAQLPLWAGELEQDVAAHREELLAQHEVAARELGQDARYIRKELEDAGFILFRLELIWQQPKRAARWTGLFLLIVLLPAFWTRFLALDSVRAYQEQRCREGHAQAAALLARGDADVRLALAPWKELGAKP